MDEDAICQIATGRHIILLNVLLLSVSGTEMTPESVQTNSGSLPMLPVTGLRPATI